MALLTALPMDKLRDAFGEHLQENVRLANYSTARVGGKADGLLIANSSDELEKIALKLFEIEAPFIVLGSGSNILISDDGVRAVIIINRARTVKIDARHEPPTVWAESGANFSGVARQVALRGLSGLEWASTIPGTVGGAVYGNAGAFGSDMRNSLLLADILHPKSGRGLWTCEQLMYDYRTSILKKEHQRVVILSTKIKLSSSAPEVVKNRMEEFAKKRQVSQPPGSSLGSIFKNPTGDYAGRLIEVAGLKGRRIGGAEISKLHANFFVSDKSATAIDIWKLIQLARNTVWDKFGIKLEFEIELLGDWPEA